MKLYLVIFTLSLIACTSQEVVYEPTADAGVWQPVADTQVAAAAPKQYSFVDVLVITPVAVDLPPSIPIDTGDSFTPDVLRWSDKIRSWSVEYGLSERIIAILMQAASCGDPDYDDGQYRFGLFGSSYLWFQPDVNMLDPDNNAAAALPVIAHYLESFDHVSAFYAYFDGRDRNSARCGSFSITIPSCT